MKGSDRNLSLNKTMSKLTVKGLLDLKGKRQLTCTTCHDYYTAKACNEAGVDIIVSSGEFVRQYIAGDFTKTTETMNDLLTTLEGVRKGAPDVFIYASLPHGVVSISKEETVRCAVTALNNGADAIYSSGMSLTRIKELADEKIPVVGHVGMVPWIATWLGGFHAVGKTAMDAMTVYNDALALQDAGCIAIEMECVPYKVATEISKRLNIIVLSMGSGFGCDGQYLFSHDMLGQHDNHYPRHSLKYANQNEITKEVLNSFVSDVATGNIEEKQKLIQIKSDEFEKFIQELK